MNDQESSYGTLCWNGRVAQGPVQCADDVQQEMAEREPEIAGEGWIRLRIGVNLGDIIVEGSDIYGDGVNVAARLEALADFGQPGAGHFM